MPGKDTHFTLEFDKANPNDKSCKNLAGTTPQPKANFVDFLDKLAEGKLTYVGGIFVGDVASEEPEAAETGGSCVILYIGGTAYKICS